MHKEKRDSNQNDILINKNNHNSVSFLKELHKIYENEYIISFKDILTISKKDFFENISTRIKNLINGKYKIEINNNDKLNTLLNNLFQQFEQKYNLSHEEIYTFLDNLKNNHNNGYKDNYITNFRKHCWKTDDFAKHNCKTKNKIGYFIPIYNNNSNTNEKNEEKQLKYIICKECQEVFSINKFLNYCIHCDVEFYSYILNSNESQNENEKNENIIQGKWENDHCELIIDQQINCPKCKGLFYIDIKYKILKCFKCKFYRSPKNIQRICNICKQKFFSDILIYNPLEKDLLSDIINNAIINKNKAHPTSIPCCQNINIFSTDFYHNKACKGILYLAKFYKRLIIFCTECNRIFIYEKFMWTCPECGKEFKDEKLAENSSFLKYEFDSKKQNNYGKNSIISTNSNFDSSQTRRKKYDKNSLNSIKRIRNDVKSEPNLIIDLKRNINNNINTNLNDKHITNTKNKIYNTNKNEKINQLNYIKEIKVNVKNNNHNIKNHNNNNINKKKESPKNNTTQRDSKKNLEKKIDKQKSNAYYNKSEANLFEYKIKNEKEKKISQKSTTLINYKNNFPFNKFRKSKINTKDEDNEKIQENKKLNKSSLIFKRNKYTKYNISLNEDKMKNNIFNLILNKNNEKNDETKNNNTKFNIYNRNFPSSIQSSSCFLYKKNLLNSNHIGNNLNTSKNSKSNIINEIKNNEKKEEKNIILNSKNDYSNRFSKDNNPFINGSSQKMKIQNYLLKNFSTTNNKEYSKNEEKKHKNKINESIKEEKSEDNKRENNKKLYNQKSTYLRNKIENIKILNNNQIVGNNKEIIKHQKNINNIKIINLKEHNNIIDNITNKIDNNIKKEFIKTDKIIGSIEKIENNKSEELNKIIELNKKVDNNKNDNKKNNNGKNKISDNSFKVKEKIKPEKEEIIKDNNYFSSKMTLIEKIPFGPNSKILNHSQNISKVAIDLTKPKSEQINSINEYKREKNYIYYKKKCIIDSEKVKLLKDIELEKKKFIKNKPEDIIEHRKIDYKKDIIIEDQYLKSHHDLYEKMQKNLKQLIHQSHLPLFNPDLYQIESKIGEGTNGSIYQVVCLKNKKKYAMKKLLADSLIALKYLIKEFDLVYDVIHPNILNIYGMNVKCFDSNAFSLCVLMDLGITDWELEINARLDQHKYYTEEELINILKQLTSALLYLQTDKKIAHRDIKPENILIFENNVYKLGDFGEAKGTKVNNKLNTLRGTDKYMSPILYHGLKDAKEDVVHNLYKSDVFSLGYSFLYAASLNHNIINEIRDLEDIDKIKNILLRMMKPRYSDTFIELILKMINLDEKTRIDFIGLDKLIKEKFD